MGRSQKSEHIPRSGSRALNLHSTRTWSSGHSLATAQSIYTPKANRDAAHPSESHIDLFAMLTALMLYKLPHPNRTSPRLHHSIATLQHLSQALSPPRLLPMSSILQLLHTSAAKTPIDPTSQQETSSHGFGVSLSSARVLAGLLLLLLSAYTFGLQPISMSYRRCYIMQNV